MFVIVNIMEYVICNITDFVFEWVNIKFFIAPRPKEKKQTFPRNALSKELNTHVKRSRRRYRTFAF